MAALRQDEKMIARDLERGEVFEESECESSCEDVESDVLLDESDNDGTGRMGTEQTETVKNKCCCSCCHTRACRILGRIVGCTFLVIFVIFVLLLLNPIPGGFLYWMKTLSRGSPEKATPETIEIAGRSYTKEKVLGSGKMGTTHLYTSSSDSVSEKEKRVVLKIAQPTPYSEEFLIQQALRMKEHVPTDKDYFGHCIPGDDCQIHYTASGKWPYFVQSLVKGAPLTHDFLPQDYRTSSQGHRASSEDNRENENNEKKTSEEEVKRSMLAKVYKILDRHPGVRSTDLHGQNVLYDKENDSVGLIDLFGTHEIGLFGLSQENDGFPLNDSMFVPGYLRLVGMNEKTTAAALAKLESDYGVSQKKGNAKTGVVGLGPSGDIAMDHLLSYYFAFGRIPSVAEVQEIRQLS